MRKLVPLLLMVALTACAKKAEDASQQVNMLKPPDAAAAASDAAVAPGAAAMAPPAPTNPPPVANPGAPQLAYTYDYTFALPSDQIERTLNRDQQACAAAGPAMCQLVGSSLSRANGGVATAHLELQAAPAWIARFRAGAEAEAKAAGGRIESAEVQSEDLSRSIVDTEATVRAKTTLRDRLQQLLAERPGKLSDMLDVERELARVQGELDATQSELAVMRARVATSKLTITYDASGVSAPNGPWLPLHEAANDFFGHVVMVLAVLLNIVSVVLPLGLVIGPLVWLLIRYLRRRKPAAKPKKSEP
jgi:hypothetical protein